MKSKSGQALPTEFARVAPFDWDLARDAVTINRPTRLAINGLDYLNYKNRGIHDVGCLTADAKAFVQHMTAVCSCSVSYLGTGQQLTRCSTL